MAGMDELQMEAVMEYVMEYVGYVGDVFNQERLDYWSVESKTSFQIFNKAISDSKEVINISIDNKHVEKFLYIMSYNHIVTAIETYLSSTLTEEITYSKSLVIELIELIEEDPRFKEESRFGGKDPRFEKQKFIINEMFISRNMFKNDIKLYLKELVFNEIGFIDMMYDSVLGVSLNTDLSGLMEAFLLRNDCVYRAGYNKDGNEIDMNKEKVEKLIEQCTDLVEGIENQLKT